MKICLDMEYLGRVNLVVRANTIVHVILVFVDIQSTSALMVTFVVDTSVIRSIAIDARHEECVHVGFHDVKFGAPVSATLDAITVLENVRVIVHSWHEDGVYAREAAAADLAQIYVIFHGASEQIWLEIFVSISWVLDS